MMKPKTYRVSVPSKMVSWDDVGELAQNRFLLAFCRYEAVEARSRICFDRNDFSRTTLALHLALNEEFESLLEKRRDLLKERNKLVQELRSFGSTKHKELEPEEPVNHARAILELGLMRCVRERNVDRLKWFAEYVEKHRDCPFPPVPQTVKDVKWAGTLQGAILRQFVILSGVSITSLFLPGDLGLRWLPTKAKLLEEVTKEWRGSTDNLKPDFYKHVKTLGLSGLPGQARPRNTISR